MRDAGVRRIRTNAAQIGRILDQLDQDDAQSSGGESHSNGYRFRSDGVLLEFPTPDGTAVRHAVPTRKLSCRELHFLLGIFAYPGTPCLAQIPDVSGQAHTLKAEIVGCRYLEGTGSLYSVVAAFAAEIQPEVFLPHAAHAEVLFADPDTARHKSLAVLIKDSNVSLTCVDQRQQGIEMAAAAAFDSLLLNMESAEFDGAGVIAELRQRGVTARAIGVLADASAGNQRRCLQAGCAGILAWPPTQATVRAAVYASQEERLLSDRRDDPKMRQLVELFVRSLTHRVARMEAAHASGDRSALLKLTRELKGQSGVFGFQIINEAAAQFEKALAVPGVSTKTQEQLSTLLRWCRAASA